MATISCSIQLQFPSPSTRNLRSSFLAAPSSIGIGQFRASKLWRAKVCPSERRGNSSGGAKCWFKFGKNGVDSEGAGIYGSQSRDDFDRDDVEQVIVIF